MAHLRLSASWPVIYRTCEFSTPALRAARAAQRFRAYHPTHRFRQEHIPQRYGTANEPPPHLGGTKGFETPARQQQDQQESGRTRSDDQQESEKLAQPVANATIDAKKEPTTVDGQNTAQSTISTTKTDPKLDAGEAMPAKPPPKPLKAADGQPLETILNSVPEPQEYKEQQESSAHAEEHSDKIFDEHAPPIKAPHMEAPRYLHHFDTYGLVKRLKEGGWDETQAVTVMKAMRVILADQTDLAKEALVSKSQLENEAYLFKAACAELKTEVTTRRKREQEKMRTERSQLQHEVDIISQRLGQETSALKDELKGVFDDRKMAVRNEQRDMESKIQQLNYQITVQLQADSKSDVEGVRWIMTRRVILALGMVVFMVVGSLKLAASAETASKAASGSKPAMASGGTQTEWNSESEERSGSREGNSSAYESLG